MIHLLANGPGSVSGGRYTTDTNYFDSNYVSRAFLANPTDGPITVNLPYEVSANSENGVWIGFRCFNNVGYGSYDAILSFFTAMTAEGTQAFRTDYASQNSNQSVRAINSAGGSAASAVTALLATVASKVKFDFHYYVSGGNVVARLYRNGSPLLTASVAGAARGVKSFVIQPLGSAETHHTAISEIVVADEDTREIRVSDKNSLSAGTHSDWAGTVDALSSANVGDVSTFAYANGTQPPLTGVRAIAMNAQMAADGGNIQAVLRKGGVDYKSGSINADATAKGLGHVWNSDPSGGSFGRLDDLAALEFGVEHIA